MSFRLMVYKDFLKSYRRQKAFKDDGVILMDSCLIILFTDGPADGERTTALAEGEGMTVLCKAVVVGDEMRLGKDIEHHAAQRRRRNGSQRVALGRNVGRQLPAHDLWLVFGKPAHNQWVHGFDAVVARIVAQQVIDLQTGPFNPLGGFDFHNQRDPSIDLCQYLGKQRNLLKGFTQIIFL